MSTEQFNLAWNQFESSTSKAFNNLYLDQDFTDVTLATKDGKQIKAHRNILSSVSPFFKTILLANPHAHPLLYLKGVKNISLQSIIKFIYLGHAEVYQENLEDFMNTADDLEISGLCKSKVTEDQKDALRISLPDANPWRPELPISTDVESNDHKEDMVVMEDIEDMTIISNDSYSDNFALNVQNPYKCLQCEFSSKDRGNLKKHIGYKHEGIRYACHHCDYKATTTSHLNRHVKNIHTVV